MHLCVAFLLIILALADGKGPRSKRSKKKSAARSSPFSDRCDDPTSVLLFREPRYDGPATLRYAVSTNMSETPVCNSHSLRKEGGGDASQEFDNILRCLWDMQDYLWLATAAQYQKSGNNGRSILGENSSGSGAVASFRLTSEQLGHLAFAGVALRRLAASHIEDGGEEEAYGISLQSMTVLGMLLEAALVPPKKGVPVSATGDGRCREEGEVARGDRSEGACSRGEENESWWPLTPLRKTEAEAEGAQWTARAAEMGNPNAQVTILPSRDSSGRHDG